jgi:hypothetical protein
MELFELNDSKNIKEVSTVYLLYSSLTSLLVYLGIEFGGIKKLKIGSSVVTMPLENSLN